MKKIFKFLTSFSLLLAPISSLVACGSNSQGGIYASRTANIDSLIALGYQPHFVNKTFDGTTLPSYLKSFVKSDYTKKLHDRPGSDQMIDNEDFISKNISSAFIANFQSSLFKRLKDSGLSKSKIGTSTMGETYIPDIDFRNNKANGESMKDRVDAWNGNQDKVNTYGKARTTSIPMKNHQLLHMDGTSALKDEASSIIDKKDHFSFTADVRESLKITAENIDRIAENKNHSVLKRAIKISKALTSRINDLKIKANVASKTILAIKPNRNAQNANEIIDPHFAWDPTIYGFLYSASIGLGYQMPKVVTDDNFQWLANDVDGLVSNSHASVKAAFKNQLDSLIFLKPYNYPISNENIKNELKSLTKTNSVENIHIMPEDTMWEGMWGPIGYFSAMDLYAKEFKISSFNHGVKNWGWDPISPQNLKTSI